MPSRVEIWNEFGVIVTPALSHQIGNLAPRFSELARVTLVVLELRNVFKGESMKLSMGISYSDGFKQAADRVVELEKAGLDQVWIAEAYSYDSISQVGYLAAVTNRVQIGTGIINVYSRTAALTAMTAAGCDYVSNGRFILGFGASGPQVVEGFHGVPYEKPMMRIKEYIQACRMIWAREEPFHMDG